MACRKRSNYRDSPSRVDDELRARVNSIEGEAVYDSWAEGAAMSTPGSSHRPRKKRKLIPSFEDPQSANLVVVDTKSNAVKPAFPLVAFLWPARGTSQWVVLPLILMIVGLFRWCAGLWGYSGMSTVSLKLFELQTNYCRRLQCASYARRFRSTEALDGDYRTSTSIDVVLS